MAQGYLQVDVVSDVNSFPVQDADIVIAGRKSRIRLSRRRERTVPGRRRIFH